MKNKLYLFVLLFSATVFAQQRQVTTAIDTTKNKIGAEFKLTLKTNVDTLSKVVFPNAKNFGALEVIQSYPIDTIKTNDRYELVKKYGLTQFDSGKYTIPRIPVMVNGQPIFSDSIRVEVANVAVDTLKQKMYDIKDIVPVKGAIGDWWLYLLALLLIAAAGFLLYKFIKKRQQRKLDEITFKTPIEKATLLLSTLEKKELWQKGEIKTYYSELTDIARNYIEETIHIPAMESTTSELIAGLRAASAKQKMTLTPETVENLERVLRQADLVKFAKSKPVDYEITEDRNKIEKVIVTLDKSLPQEIQDEALQNQMFKENLIRKQRRNRILTTLAVVIGLLIATTAYFVVTKGFGYVKDTVVGNHTKALLEGDWVLSEYGDPIVRIETPKVLKRQDVSKVLPKQAMAFIKDMNMFAYGSMTDPFYVLVATSKFEKETDFDLNKALEGSIKTLEQRGAQNILVKQEAFKTQQGIDGLRAYGTMSFLDPIRQKSLKCYYEMLLFKQENGLQQIVVTYEEGDTYGPEILARIINSVELQNTNKTSR